MLTNVLVSAGVVVLLFCLTPLADVYSTPLVVAGDPQKSDAIVLMSAGLIDSEWITPDGAQRTWGALRLYKEHYAAHVISVGSEQAEVQARMLERAGIPATDILVDRASNTYWSVRAVSQIMRDRDWKTAVIVTSQFDVPRIRLIFRSLGGVQASFFPVPEFRKPKPFHVFRHSAFDIAYHASYEYAALMVYKWRGWI